MSEALADYDALRAVAEAATTGPWGGEVMDGDVWAPGNRERICKTSSFNYGRDAAYIAAASPDVVLALLDEIEALRAKVAECERFAPPEFRYHPSWAPPEMRESRWIEAALDDSSNESAGGRI